MINWLSVTGEMMDKFSFRCRVKNWERHWFSFYLITVRTNIVYLFGRHMKYINLCTLLIVIKNNRRGILLQGKRHGLLIVTSALALFMK